MRYLLITKWIHEVNSELAKAKKEVNFMKVYELNLLLRDLNKLRDQIKN